MFRAARVAGVIACALVLAIGTTTDSLQARSQPAPSTVATNPQVRLAIPDRSERDRQRITSAAEEAIARYSDWLGPSRFKEFEIAVANKPFGTDSHSTVEIDLPMRSAPESMDLESQVVFGLAWTWWVGLRAFPDTAARADALGWYLQSRIVPRLYDLTFLAPAHSATSVRFFGDAVPWAFSILPLQQRSGGLAREEVLRAYGFPAVGVAPGRRLYPNLSAASLRGAQAFATLENLVGWPAMQGAIRALADRSHDHAVPVAESEAILSSALGQDFAWFFRTAFNPSIRFDYAIQPVVDSDAGSCGPSCVRTRVTVERRGEGVLAPPRTGANSSFETSDFLEVRVGFADGQHASARWDGREATRTFEFESTTPAVVADVDPDRVLLLDENLLNNTWRRETRTNVPLRKWVAYWMVWLEGVSLDYAGLFI